MEEQRLGLDHGCHSTNATTWAIDRETGLGTCFGNNKLCNSTCLLPKGVDQGQRKCILSWLDALQRCTVQAQPELVSAIMQQMGRRQQQRVPTVVAYVSSEQSDQHAYQQGVSSSCSLSIIIISEGGVGVARAYGWTRLTHRTSLRAASASMAAEML